MKFFYLLALGVVFLTVFTRADDENEEEDDEDDDDEAQALSSAMQLNGNNVGDINNIKGRQTIPISHLPGLIDLFTVECILLKCTPNFKWKECLTD